MPYFELESYLAHHEMLSWTHLWNWREFFFLFSVSFIHKAKQPFTVKIRKSSHSVSKFAILQNVKHVRDVQIDQNGCATYR